MSELFVEQKRMINPNFSFVLYGLNFLSKKPSDLSSVPIPLGLSAISIANEISQYTQENLLSFLGWTVVLLRGNRAEFDFGVPGQVTLRTYFRNELNPN